MIVLQGMANGRAGTDDVQSVSTSYKRLSFSSIGLRFLLCFLCVVVDSLIDTHSMSFHSLSSFVAQDSFFNSILQCAASA